jgi:hypothetical protein
MTATAKHLETVKALLADETEPRRSFDAQYGTYARAKCIGGSGEYRQALRLRHALFQALNNGVDYEMMRDATNISTDTIRKWVNLAQAKPDKPFHKLGERNRATLRAFCAHLNDVIDAATATATATAAMLPLPPPPPPPAPQELQFEWTAATIKISCANTPSNVNLLCHELGSSLRESFVAHSKREELTVTAGNAVQKMRGVTMEQLVGQQHNPTRCFIQAVCLDSSKLTVVKKVGDETLVALELSDEVKDVVPALLTTCSAMAAIAVPHKKQLWFCLAAVTTDMIHHSEKVTQINAALGVSPSYDFLRDALAAASVQCNESRFEDGWTTRRRNVKSGDDAELEEVYNHLKPDYTLRFAGDGHLATGRDNYQNIHSASRNSPGYQTKNSNRTRTSGVFWWVDVFELDGKTITPADVRKSHNEEQRQLKDVKIGEFFLGSNTDATSHCPQAILQFQQETIGLDMQTYMTELLDELISNQDSGAQAAPEFKRQRKPTKVKKRQRAQPDGSSVFFYKTAISHSPLPRRPPGSMT